MIVSNLRAPLSFAQCTLERGHRENHRAESHGRTVSQTVVRLPRTRLYPVPKPRPVASVGVLPRVFVELVDVGGICEEAIGDCDSQDAVIGEPASFDKEGKVHGLLLKELMHRTDNVASYRTEHLCSPIGLL